MILKKIKDIDKHLQIKISTEVNKIINNLDILIQQTMMVSPLKYIENLQKRVQSST